MKQHLWFLSIMIIVSPLGFAALPENVTSEDSPPASSSPTNAETELTFSELVLNGREKQAEIIEGSLLATMLRFDTLSERSKHFGIFERQLAAHADKCNQPNAFPGYEIILEDMRANPDTAAAASAIAQMEQLLGLLASGSLSSAARERVVSNLEQRKARDIQTRKLVICGNQTKVSLANIINERLLSQIKLTFAAELERLKKYRELDAIDKWKLTNLIAAAQESNETTELPDIATLIREIQAYKAAIEIEEARNIQSEIGRLSGVVQTLETLITTAQTVVPSDEAETSLIQEMIAAIRQDQDETRESLAKDHVKVGRLKS